MAREKIAHTMDLPPAQVDPNVFPLDWRAATQRMEEIWDASQREYWDPKKLPWDTFDASRYTWEEREAIAYWWSVLSVFDASAPPVFAAALIKTYEAHEEDPVRRCFFSVTRDEQNHEQMCGLAITKLLEAPSYLQYEPKTDVGRMAKRNVQWLYYNGARYWEGYKTAVPKYSLAVLFSSFLMGEIAAATIFHQMAEHCTEPVFKEAFRSIGRDEGLTKLLFDPATKRLLGAGIVGPNAGELIGAAVLALEMGADVEDIALTIHPHPTLSETLCFAAEMAEGTITDLMPRRKG
jgi:hypothetical protein